MQFGEGNFLRAFADHFIDEMNEKAGFNAKVVLVQPRDGHPEAADRFGEQDGLYTLILRGRENGEPVEHTRVISAASRCLDPKRDWAKLLDCARNPELRFVISNTTEAGIAFDPACKAEDAPLSAFSAKLTLFLHERWKLGYKGIIILSCELIDHNGQELHRCVQEYVKLWGLEDDFAAWLEKENVFCSTLVDRIVTGGAKGEAPALWEKFGYEDQLIDTGEVFTAWVIEGPQWIKEEFPFEKAGLPIQVVYENPSPGNKAGGITTLEDKSCGCVQKGGSAQIVDVLEYAEPVTKKGLNLLSGPGNDLVSATDLTAAGAHMILFTTGRGTPFGAPAPTVKISTNSALYNKKGNWIDFNAGSVAEGESLDDAGDRLLDYVLRVASGEKTKAEQHGAKEIAIFKDGVTL